MPTVKLDVTILNTLTPAQRERAATLARRYKIDERAASLAVWYEGGAVGLEDAPESVNAAMNRWIRQQARGDNGKS